MTKHECYCRYCVIPLQYNVRVTKQDKVVIKFERTNVIDIAVRQYSSRFRAHVKAKGRHFEYSLSQ